MQQHFIVLETQANGTQRNFALENTSPIKALPNARYALIDANTGISPEGLKLHRVKNTLNVLLNNETVLQIHDFYNENALAQFSTEQAFVAKDEILITAGTDIPAELTGASSGDVFDNMTVSQSVYSLAMFGLVAGGVASEYNNDQELSARDKIFLAGGFKPAIPTVLLASDTGVSETDFITNNPTVYVRGVADTATWEYSTDGGTTWIDGTGGSFNLPANTSYSAESIQVRQTSEGGVRSNPAIINSAVTIDSVAPNITFTHSAYDDTNNLLLLTGTNVNSLLEGDETSSTNIAGKMDWSKLQWDTNDDNTGNITFAEGDIFKMVAANDTTLIIELTSTKADAIESDPDYGPTVPDALHIEAGFSRDTAGNASTTDGFNSEPFTSTVIFDLVNGQSSSHSNRTFDADTSYTIYIMVNSYTGTGTGLIQPPKWTEGGALGSDDTIVLTGNGSPVIGMHSGYVIGANIRSSTTYHDMVVTWVTADIGGWALRFNLHDGLITRFPLTSNFFSQRIYLWNSSNSHSHSLQIGYMTNLPAGALTSQGLV
jgi:hypothetical protein